MINLEKRRIFCMHPTRSRDKEWGNLDIPSTMQDLRAQPCFLTSSCTHMTLYYENI